MMWLIKKRYLIYLISFICISVIGSSCTENRIEITDPLENSANQREGETVDFEIGDSLSDSKSITIFGPGRYVTIYAYLHGASTTTPPIQTQYYKSNSSGRLVPIGSPMKLITGHYDFYAVSANTLANRTPSFTNGLSSALSNNTDYLWAKMNNITVYRGKNKVSFAFRHVCSEIIIEVKETLFTIVHFIDDVRIAVPNGKGIMNLSSGQIRVIPSFQKKLQAMTVTDNICQIVLLPYKDELPLQVIFKLWVNFHWEYKLYSTRIPLPNNTLRPGRAYKYEAIVDDEIFDLQLKDSVLYTPD